MLCLRVDLGKQSIDEGDAVFTGLIQDIGTLIRTDRQGSDARMVIKSHGAFQQLELGESISVDGACLTVAAFSGNVFSADVSVETLNRTTLGSKAAGSRLNLERALRLGDRLGGHLVSGHVDAVGTLLNRSQDGRSWRLFFEVPPEAARYIVEKGSIAIDGISLTVNGCGLDCFDVNIVPHTARQTTIQWLESGDRVNIETDLIGKYVGKMLSGWERKLFKGSDRSSIDLSFLEKHGFL
ncbi:riboflavin synthase [Desulfoferrobacter suflitae]|uniref:riboflavin synthase n=1 Tax=Desulfoferrobacter suflitae TaxID=2865782 RepID=UPI0021643A52|nr:riboflavin synthase [Desulfoferrobacter suflitae]MCK8601926.1 riboflavin synthase [Desulfoferrobacter suflitae]